MEKRPFGKSGLSVSILGFGGAPIGFLKTDIDRVGDILNLLLDAGVNLIDTAASYPGSEQAIAQTVRSRRDQYILVSKCGGKLPDIDAEPWSEKIITQTIDRSLRNLQIDLLDVMLLHTCDLPTLKKGEALGALVKARSAGKIRFCGYSGDNETAAYAATLPDISVIQTSINIADQANIDLLLPAARQHNIGVMAKRPIANAAWKQTSQQPGMYGGYAQTYHDRLQKMNLSPDDLGFPGDPAQAWPEIALRFTLSQPGLTTAIIGTTNPDNARANIAHAAKGPLPDATIQKIRAAFRTAESASNSKWTGQG